ncbi:hypothetical protein J3Q07_16530 [Pseudomonas sp. D4-18]|uniref:hypothetical protein n=1 Tax=Pseudomonas sp. D4-18 TaxID=2817395 RepID=UPI003DA8DD31
MQTTTNINPPANVTTRFAGSENVSRDFAHLTLAMNAAKQIRFQYSKPAKKQLVRECLDQLRAFLAYSKGART